MNYLEASKVYSLSYQILYKTTQIAANYFELFQVSSEDIWDYYPVVLFVEGATYDIDTVIEEVILSGHNGFNLTMWAEVRERIIAVLHEQGFYHPLIETYLIKLGDYYELENQLMYHGEVTFDKVMNASRHSLYDMHFMRILVAKIRDKELGPEDVDFDIWEAVMIVIELRHNLYDYPKDVVDGTYNWYHLLVHLYGQAAPDYAKTELERAKAMFETRLGRLPVSQQASYRQRLRDFCHRMYVRRTGKLLSHDEQLDEIPEPILEPKFTPYKERVPQAMPPIAQRPVSQQHYLSYKNLQQAGQVLRQLDKSLFPFKQITDRTRYYPLLLFVNALICEAETEISHPGDISPWLERKKVVVALLQEMKLYQPFLESSFAELDHYFQLLSQFKRETDVTSQALTQWVELKSTPLRFSHAVLAVMLNEPQPTAGKIAIWL